MVDHLSQLLATSLHGDPAWPIVCLSFAVVIGGFLAYHKSMGRSFSFGIRDMMAFVTAIALYLGAFAYIRYWISH
jgi:hypothetical protein